MEYTDIIYLVQKSKSFDEVGNTISSETLNKCYAKEQAVRTKEFYNAVENGLTIDAELRIKKSNYNNEEEIEWNNKRYSIIRTIPITKMDMVLIIGKKTGING